MENLQAPYRDRTSPVVAAQKPAAGVARTNRTPQSGTARGSAAASPVVAILSAGLAAEIVLPWVAIWVSDALFLDIPAWSLWLLFGVAPALSLLALLVRWVWRIGARRFSGCPAKGWIGASPCHQ
jgi:hypothetical protein